MKNDKKVKKVWKNIKLRFCDFVYNDWTCVVRLSWQFFIICQKNISRPTAAACKFIIAIKKANKQFIKTTTANSFNVSDIPMVVCWIMFCAILIR